MLDAFDVRPDSFALSLIREEFGLSGAASRGHWLRHLRLRSAATPCRSR
jgi:hypothetical protein